MNPQTPSLTKDKEDPSAGRAPGTAPSREPADRSFSYRELRRAWFFASRAKAAELSGNRCAQCDAAAPAEAGFIRLLRHPPKWWLLSIEACLARGVCVWLCKSCYEREQPPPQPGDGAKPRHGGNCSLCGSWAGYGWDRGLALLGPGKCLCKDCGDRLRAEDGKARDGA